MSDLTDHSVTHVAGELTRFHVASESTDVPYLVDLAPYNGNGGCGCLHFTCRLEPKLVAGERDFVEYKYACKHILRARAAFALDMIRTLDKNK